MGGFRAGAPPIATPEVSPLKPLHDFGGHVEEARLALLKAAKIADASDIPLLHMKATDLRERVMRLEVEVAELTGGM